MGVGACAAALLAVVLWVLAAPPAAPAATGDLSYVGCISADTAVTPAGSGACAQSGVATPGGSATGLDNPGSVAVSRDGRHVYASGDDDAVVVFNRNPATGVITYNSCFTGDSTLAACFKDASATPGGDDSGLGNLDAIALSPDDENLYVLAQDDYAVTWLKRNSANGRLSFGGCVSGRATTAPTCVQSPTATGSGSASGFSDVESLVVSADGTSVYATSGNDDGVLRLIRGPGGGLSFGGCWSGSTQPAGCAKVPSASFSGAGSGLDDPESIAISPDGRHLYVGAASDDAIARFNRAPQTGAIAFAGCISAETQSAAACAQFPGAASAGSNTGFDRPTAIAASRDGENLYVSSRDDDAITVLARNPMTGAVSHQGCISGETESAACAQIPSAKPGGTNSGIDRHVDVEVSQDDASVYAAGHFDDSVISFDRNRVSGALAFDGCISGETQSSSCVQIADAKASGIHSGLDAPTAVAATLDGRGLIAAASDDDAIASFSREPSPACSDGLDNDLDGKTDHPADPGCAGPGDGSEVDPPDTTAPKLRVFGRKKQRFKRAIKVKATVDEAARVKVAQRGKRVKVKRRAGATTAARPRIRFKRQVKQFAKGATKRFKLSPRRGRDRRKLKRLLRRGKKVTVRLKGVATDGSDNKARDRFKVKLRR